MNTVTVDQFRTDLPEFDVPDGTAAEAAPFPDDTIQFWLNLAYKLLNYDRFGDDLMDVAVEMFTAHHVVLEAMNQREVDAKGLPGITKGAIAAKSVGDVSVTYNNNVVIDPEAKHWNYTNYGIRLYALMRLVGVGPLQVGGCGGFGMGAWSGPPLGPGYE